jgi:hypothetical protein
VNALSPLVDNSVDRPALQRPTAYFLFAKDDCKITVADFLPTSQSIIELAAYVPSR